MLADAALARCDPLGGVISGAARVSPQLGRRPAGHEPSLMTAAEDSQKARRPRRWKQQRRQTCADARAAEQCDLCSLDFFCVQEDFLS